MSEYADKNQVNPTSGGTTSRHGTFGAENSSEGLVFGEVDDGDVFSTPLSVTRASSRATESPSMDGAFYSPPTSPPPADQAAAPAAAGPAAALEGQHAAAAGEEDVPSVQQDSTTGSAPEAVGAEQDRQQALSPDSNPIAADSTQAVVPNDAADEPVLVDSATAAPAASGQQAQPGPHAADEPQQPASTSGPELLAPVQPAAAGGAAATAEYRSGLLSLAELKLSSSSSSSSHMGQAGSQPQPPSPSSPSSASSASADASMTAAAAAVEAAANSSAVEPDPAAAAAVEEAAMSAAAGHLPGSGSSGGAAAPGTSAAQTGSRSSSRQLQEGVAVSPPCSPIAVRSSSGLERAASWQLQHAAAAAAGTAAHAAPPRSDMDLAKLSNTPASPHGESGWAAWQQRRRHFFVLTAAGKPVYSRHGDEQALAGFMAVIQALLSVMTDQGDVIHSITVGSSSLEFLLRGQLYLVAVSSRSEAQAALRRQLELLYQTILMVATGGIERLLMRSPGYDVQQLLAGAKPNMDALISGFGDCPGWMMASVEAAPTAAADRQQITAALHDAVKGCDCLYGILLVAGRVVAVECGSGAPALNVFDLLLLINFTSSNESLRHNETFVPVCLPNFQPNAFVHAYVNCLDDVTTQQQLLQQDALGSQQQQLTEAHQQQQHHQQPEQQLPHLGGNRGESSRSTFLLLLSGSADAFHKLSAAQQAFVAAATAGPGGGVLSRVQAAAVQPGRGRVRVEALPAPLGGSVGSTPLWHALIRFPARHQHITLAYPQQLFSTRSQIKQLVRSYCRLYCAVYGQLLEANATATAAGPFGSGSGTSTGGSSSSVHHAATAAAAGKAHKLVWVTSQHWVTGVLADRDVEVYVVLDPLTEKDVGLKMAETLQRLFGDKARRQDLLVPGL